MPQDDTQADILEACLEWARGLSDEDQKWLKELGDEDLTRQHFGLGLTVRNLFLWQMTPEQGKKVRTTLVEGGDLENGYLTRPMHPDDLWVPLVKWVQSEL